MTVIPRNELIHLFTYSLSKRAAFTLAEVLITLGIIGVVAAMTMPSLIANYQKKVWVNQLKKSVSVLEQGFQKMLADDGVDKLTDTSVWANLHGMSSILFSDGMIEENVKFANSLKQYFKCNDQLLNYANKYMSMPAGHVNDVYLGDKSYNIILADGSMITYETVISGDTRRYLGDDIAANIVIDVNGIKTPNTYGRDVFVFDLSESGNLIPRGIDDWKDDPLLCGVPGNKESVLNSDGDGCAARIIENGWVMDY